MLISNLGTPAASMAGQPLPLSGADQTVQYDTPRRFAERTGYAFAGIGSTQQITVSIRDILTGNAAAFTTGYIYCNLVYGDQRINPAVGIRFNDRMVNPPHA